MSQTLAEGIVVVSADAKDIPKDIQRQIEGNQSPIESAGRRSGTSLFGGFAKIAVGATAGIATAVGGLAIAGGFSRALSIQDATKKLEGLGHDTTSIASIMDSALSSVKGTAFGLGEAAGTSAGLVAAGVGLGDELTRRLKTVADTATIAGRSMEDVGTIFGSVAAKGKLQGDDMLQLMSSGVPVLQFLAQHLGLTSEEISDMVSKGQIDFATFADAMEEGIGGAALKGGETARGAFANVMSALGRLGDAFVAPLVAGAPALFSSITSMIDGVTKAAGPLAEAFAARVAPGIQAVSEWLGTLDFAQIANSVATFSPLLAVLDMLKPIFPEIMDALRPLGPAFQELATALGPLVQSAVMQLIPLIVGLVTAFADLLGAAAPVISFVAENVDIFASLAVGVGILVGAIKLWQAATILATGIQAAFNLVMNANPIMLIVTAIAALVGGLIYFFTQTELGQAIWAEFTRFLGEAWTNIVNFATEVWTNLANFFTDLWTGITTVVTDVWNNIVAFLTPIFEVIGNIIRVYTEVWVNIIIVMAAILVTIWQGIVDVVTFVWNAIASFLGPIIQWIVDSIVTNITNAWNFWSMVWGAVSSFFVDVWNNIVAFATPIVQAVVNAVRGPINAIVGWWNGVWSSISGFFSGIWQGMVGAVSNAIGQIGGFVGGIADTVMNALGNVGSWLVNAGGDLVRGFWEGIVNMGDWLFRQVSGFFDDVTGWAKGVLGIQSPSRVFRFEVGQMVGEGMALGISDSAVVVRHAIDDLVTVPGVAAQRVGMNAGAAASGANAATRTQDMRPISVELKQTIAHNDPTLAGRQAARAVTEYLGV